MVRILYCSTLLAIASLNGVFGIELVDIPNSSIDSFTKGEMQLTNCSEQSVRGHGSCVFVSGITFRDLVSCCECGGADFLLRFDLLTLSNEENKLTSNHKCREVWVPANVISPFPFLKGLFSSGKLTYSID